MDAHGLGISLVVDDARVLIGTITDGDVRRALLSQGSLNATARDIMNSTPLTVTQEIDRTEVKRIFFEKRIRHLPVLNTGGSVVGLFQLRDLIPEIERRGSKLPAVLMAGGFGSRLGDLTKSTPKPLLEVGGKPILERIVEHLEGHGIGQIYITTRYLADQIESHFGDGSQWGVSIDYVREKQRLGTAGSLALLQGEVSGPFLVMNGDLLTNINVEQMLDFHEENDADMTVAVRHYTMGVPFGVVEVEGVEIKSLSEKPTYEFFVNAGVYIIEPSLLKYVSGDEMFDITELIETAIENGHRITSFPVVEKWMDIGRPEDLEAAQSTIELD